MVWCFLAIKKESKWGRTGAKSNPFWNEKKPIILPYSGGGRTHSPPVCARGEGHPRVPHIREGSRAPHHQDSPRVWSVLGYNNVWKSKISRKREFDAITKFWTFWFKKQCICFFCFVWINGSKINTLTTFLFGMSIRLLFHQRFETPNCQRFEKYKSVKRQITIYRQNS